ncbi:hypothetical protein [Aliiglaciecola lipolytica]|jgi:hypothetical protein|uniref:hypothetical protein n=1 Tax=Aliiglaciecola lipolytica TaxID=477689 RepID=UPI001C08BF51|nr:hypothetical protein [Aliiglaciecola lipolytica]MBU2879141.1 hypothetical protein [Aliiglaciecola lipolytica]
MIKEIAIFYIAVFSIYLLLSIFWRSKISQIAFIWFGPIPLEYEYLAEFKLRKFKYAFGWLLQFVYAISVVFLLASYFSWLQKETYFLVVTFALPIGFGMALLASIGFLLSYLKTALFGPNPYFEFVKEDDLDDET